MVVTGSVFSSPFSVVEMAGGTGAEVWRYEPVGPGGADAVAVDAAGDVIASGSIQFDFTVVKLDDVTGAELWRTDLQGTAGGGLADAVAVDGAGDVVAAGHVANTGTPSDLAVVKLDGTTGAELWRYEVNGSHPTSTDDAAAVVLDTSGDAFVAGGTSNDSGTFFVARVDGTNGMEVWRAEIADGRARAIALDATGGLIAGGHLSDSYAVVRLDPADGSEIWRYTEIGLSGVDAVAVDASGAVSAGHRRIGPDDIIVVSHALADGSAVWRQDLGDNGTPHDVEFDAAGDVAVGAYNDGFYVAKLSRLDGVVGPVAGTSLTGGTGPAIRARARCASRRGTARSSHRRRRAPAIRRSGVPRSRFSTRRRSRRRRSCCRAAHGPGAARRPAPRATSTAIPPGPTDRASRCSSRRASSAPAASASSVTFPSASTSPRRGRSSCPSRSVPPSPSA